MHISIFRHKNKINIYLLQYFFDIKSFLILKINMIVNIIKNAVKIIIHKIYNILLSREDIMTKEVFLFIENEFRDEEAIYPYYRFKEAGYDVKVIGPEKDKEYRGKFGLVLKSDLSASQADPDNAAAIIIPGGNAPDKMRINKDMVELVKKAFLKGKVIATICHGGWMLVEADIVRGRKVTGYKAIATDLKNAGGEYIDSEVIVDGNFVTSRVPGDLPAFCSSILKLI
jgi:protease I